MQAYIGNPYPLGLSFNSNLANFALQAKKAKAVSIEFFNEENAIVFSFELDPNMHKTGHIWHISFLKEKLLGLSYLFKINQSVMVLDPYAKHLNSKTSWYTGADCKTTKAIVYEDPVFDWENITPPHRKLKECIIYEMHTRSFTIKANVTHPGTFLGIIEKIPYLKALGVNTIELMPIHEFNENEYQKEGLCNFWGYSPLSYFCLMQRYGTKSEKTLEEFKTLVKELHRHDISIIIDVVYNHTAEKKHPLIIYHLMNLDEDYYLHHHHDLIDFTGCGNTLDANTNPGRDLVIDSLKFLALECHVDGFRFDLASTFYRKAHGVLHDSFIIKQILEDPILSEKILIAEAWDAHGLYQVGNFPKPFGDWNGAYRDKVRSFFRNDPFSKGAFADAISGTQSLYHHKGPCYSINFITAHDGFSLYDLFSYENKHNLANLEQNRDGSNHNLSQNCGHEGETKDPQILLMRKKLLCAAFATLILSLGTPMLLMGDEYGHTRLGNNNAWCQNNDLNFFLWDKQDPEMIQFICQLIELRKQIPELSSDHFFTRDKVQWKNSENHDLDWSMNDFFLMQICASGYIILYNLSNDDRSVKLPEGSFKQILCSANLNTSSSEPVISSHTCPKKSICVLKTV